MSAIRFLGPGNTLENVSRLTALIKSIFTLPRLFMGFYIRRFYISIDAHTQFFKRHFLPFGAYDFWSGPSLCLGRPNIRGMKKVVFWFSALFVLVGLVCVSHAQTLSSSHPVPQSPPAQTQIMQ